MSDYDEVAELEEDLYQRGKELAKLRARLEAAEKNAIYLAHIWRLIRLYGSQYLMDEGDPDGIDYVANTVLVQAGEG